MVRKVSALLPATVITVLSLVAGYQWLMAPARTTPLAFSAEFIRADVASRVFAVLVTFVVADILVAFIVPQESKRVFPLRLDRMLWLFGVAVQIFLIAAAGCTLFMDPDSIFVEASFDALLEYLPAIQILAVCSAVLTQLASARRQEFQSPVIDVAAVCFVFSLGYEFFYIFMFLYEAQLEDQPTYDVFALAALVVCLAAIAVLCVPFDRRSKRDESVETERAKN